MPSAVDEIGTFTIPADHPSLPGHFPGRPVVPGVVLLDEAAALILATRPDHHLAGFPSVRFARPVRPGDAVQVCFRDSRFTCAVAGETVLSGTIDLATGR